MNPIRCQRCGKVCRSSESRQRHLCAQCDPTLRPPKKGEGARLAAGIVGTTG
jgi:uncharacterized C2H2 Zn-finger protein